MTPIEEAVRREEEARKTYAEAAARVRDVGARKILTLLAEQEAEHAKALRAVAKRSAPADEGLVAEARTWIQSAIEGGALRISEDAELLEILRRASDLERKTEAFYREQARADEERNPRHAELFRELADAERGHFVFVTSLVDYFDRPSAWIEAAEFGLRPDY
ncbi:MAG: ferritin family protein [Candidatus Bipolaricaulota bacterium]